MYPRQASPGFACSYPSGWTSCNDADNRDCWVKAPDGTQYDINSDYETLTPSGTTREYFIEISEKDISPDGYSKPLAKVINGTYPGPLIEACWGDDIVVHVTNQLPDNGTTIHWHGIRQLNSNEMDGVNGVTQCPIAQGSTFTYSFKALQYGHSWYHSHYSLQYPDGVAGPLLIHGPTSADWDEEWAPVLLTDWVHESAFELFQTELAGPGIPVADSLLFDGQGHYTCDSSDPQCVGTGSYFNRTFEAGKRYLIRIINASAATHFVFSIDNHVMQVVSADFVPIQPYNTTALEIAIGQRYSIIVEATPDTPTTDGNYWIRTVSAGCSNGVHDTANYTTGIIRYDDNSTALPSSSAYNFVTACADEPYANLIPIVPWTVGQPQNNVTNNTYEVGLDTTQDFHGYLRWDILNQPMWLDFSNPTILNLDNTTWNPEYCVVDYDYTQGFVYMVLTASALYPDHQKFTGATHPIHLHGHDFAILAQNTTAYDPANSPATFNFNNPPRRDVALLPSNGYLAIAFKPDNPGVWLLHCHIAWHASSGLALQILERQSEIAGSIGSLDDTKSTCTGWDTWLAANPTVFNPAQDQDDSGI